MRTLPADAGIAKQDCQQLQPYANRSSEAWPSAIPMLLHIVLKDASTRSANVNRTLHLFAQETHGAGRSVLWDDRGCLGAFACGISIFGETLMRNIRFRFESASIPGYKSDLCRYVVLSLHGGLYSDDDNEYIDAPGSALLPRDTFVAPIEAGNDGLFQAYLATTPRHPVLMGLINELGALTRDPRHAGKNIWNATLRTNRVAIWRLAAATQSLVRPYRLRETGLNPRDPLHRNLQAGPNCNCVVRDHADHVHFYSHSFPSHNCNTDNRTIASTLNSCANSSMPLSSNRHPRESDRHTNKRDLMGTAGSETRLEGDRVIPNHENQTARVGLLVTPDQMES